tara:strand:+ start:664 stop:966 length:303 start_codon:yes stop_codon:yes gene_type:complete
MVRPQTKNEINSQERLLKVINDLKNWMDDEFDSCHIPSKVAIMQTFNELSYNVTDHVCQLLLSLDKEIREDEEKLSNEDFAKVKAYAESLHRKKQGKKNN